MQPQALAGALQSDEVAQYSHDCSPNIANVKGNVSVHLAEGACPTGIDGAQLEAALNRVLSSQLIKLRSSDAASIASLNRTLRSLIRSEISNVARSQEAALRQLESVIIEAIKESATTAAQANQARLRIRHVLVVGPGEKFPHWPVLNIYYDNAGTAAMRGVVVRYAGTITNLELSDEFLTKEQDRILDWEGWLQSVQAKSGREIYPGDSGDFTTIPPEENSLAIDFRQKFDDIAAGRARLYVMIAFKYGNAGGALSQFTVTEECFWFSGGNWARHNCGRSRTFMDSN